MIIRLMILVLALLPAAAWSPAVQQGGAVEWLSFGEAIERHGKEPRKILVEVYTKWCVFCKKMDKSTLLNAKVSEFISNKFYAVRLDAETRDTIRYRDKVFVLDRSVGPNGTHELALALLEGRAAYPGFVFLDDSLQMLEPVIGYKTAEDFEPYLRYYGDNHYRSMNWKAFLKKYYK